MAWTKLRTDYTDATWSGLKKYKQSSNDDGTVSFEDKTVYSNKEKSFFGAKDANAMNGAINELMTLEQAIIDGKGIAHNGIYRGAYLGEKPTTAQYNAIADTRFADMYIGDYWHSEDVYWIIAGFDYFWGYGDESQEGGVVNKTHIVIVPDGGLYEHDMMPPGGGDIGYVATELYQSGFEAALEKIEKVFSGHVMEHYIRLEIKNGYSNSFVKRKIDLMTQPMVFGSYLFGSGHDGTERQVLETTQLPLFAYDRRAIRGNTHAPAQSPYGWWLRDMTDNDNYASVTPGGWANLSNKHMTLNVRPYFCIS